MFVIVGFRVHDDLDKGLIQCTDLSMLTTSSFELERWDVSLPTCLVELLLAIKGMTALIFGTIMFAIIRARFIDRALVSAQYQVVDIPMLSAAFADQRIHQLCLEYLDLLENLIDVLSADCLHLPSYPLHLDTGR